MIILYAKKWDVIFKNAKFGKLFVGLEIIWPPCLHDKTKVSQNLPVVLAAREDGDLSLDASASAIEQVFFSAKTFFAKTLKRART